LETLEDLTRPVVPPQPSSQSLLGELIAAQDQEKLNERTDLPPKEPEHPQAVDEQGVEVKAGITVHCDPEEWIKRLFGGE